MHVDQGRLFEDSEADRWFQRNREGLTQCDSSHDLPLRLIELYSLHPTNVLEIGASNGCRLAAIANKHGARTVAVEPSGEAIADGRERFGKVEFVQAMADAVPLKEQFDLAIVNFVLHWVDRFKLLRVVAEVDRLLCDGGSLIVGDFLPGHPTRVPYHHLPQQKVYTYKQDYATLFTNTGLYRQVAMLTADHASKGLDAAVSDDDRIAAWLLRKELQGRYAERSLSR